MVFLSFLLENAQKPFTTSVHLLHRVDRAERGGGSWHYNGDLIRGMGIKTPKNCWEKDASYRDREQKRR